jgi:hypothetical protein
MSSPQVLAERDTNVPISPEKKENGKPKSLEYHRQVLESRLKEGKSVAPESQPGIAASTLRGNTHADRIASRNDQAYVSPSDNILSPATQKLAAFKQKHLKA